MRRIDSDVHLKMLIESMSREGRSEREIVAAVRRAGGHPHERGRRDESAQRRRKRA
jgi:hypothetical protein